MTLNSAAARRLIDERGAELRTVVLDDTGNVLGVGRRTSVAPGWLRDATLAIHDTCTEPGCLTAARACDLDHARPWQPTRPGDVPGRTDLHPNRRRRPHLAPPANHARPAEEPTRPEPAPTHQATHRPTATTQRRPSDIARPTAPRVWATRARKRAIGRRGGASVGVGSRDGASARCSLAPLGRAPWYEADP